MHKLSWIQNKIVEPDTLQRRCQIWHSLGKKVVFTNGCFDILHHGHIDLIANAANYGNKLIVGVNTDASVKRLKGESRPVNHELDRVFQLAALMHVDAVCLFDEDTPINLIEMVKPDVLVKGGDYEPDTIVGADYVKANGGRVEIVPFVTGYSTSSTIEQIKKL